MSFCLPRLVQVTVILMLNRPGKTAPVFHPEFGRFMLEATPGRPWGIDLKDLLDVEPDMKWRYARIQHFPSEELWH